jgi:hypothetical protein
MHGKILARLEPSGDHSLTFRELMRQLILYSTAHCHLCEKALDLLMGMPNLNAVQLDVVDVASTTGCWSATVSEFLFCVRAKKNLPAPFTAEDLERFLSS